MSSITLKGKAEKLRLDRVKQAIATGQYSVQIVGDEIILGITQDLDKNDMASPVERARVSDVEELAAKHEVPLTKRKYTKRDDWVRPDLSRQHEENRPDVRFQTRLDKDTDDLVKSFLGASSMTKKSLVTAAIKLYIEEHGNNLG